MTTGPTKFVLAKHLLDSGAFKNTTTEVAIDTNETLKVIIKSMTAHVFPQDIMPETVLHEKISQETKRPDKETICRTCNSHQQIAWIFPLANFNHTVRKDAWRQDSRSDQGKHYPELVEVYASTRVLAHQEIGKGICWILQMTRINWRTSGQEGFGQVHHSRQSMQEQVYLHNSRQETRKVKWQRQGQAPMHVAWIQSHSPHQRLSWPKET